MNDTDFHKALLSYVIHIAENQARIAEAMVAISRQADSTAAILERVVQTTDRTAQMVARLLASVGEE